jgi:hypothetical protein
MEGRIKPSAVLNAPPAKESDPFCTSATLLPLRPCRRNTFQKESFRCILTLLAPVATLLPTEPSPSPNVRFRPATFPRELRSGLGRPQRSFRASDEQHPRRFAPWRPLDAVALVPFAGRPLPSRVRRARAASRVALCDLILEVPRYPPFPCCPLMAFRTTDTVFGHPNAANIWNGRFASTSGRFSAARFFVPISLGKDRLRRSSHCRTRSHLRIR